MADDVENGPSPTSTPRSPWAHYLRRLRRLVRPLNRLETRAHGRERLVDSPVFVLSSVRSGSTLLRLTLDAHPQIRAPHELHLNAVRVRATGMSAVAMRELGFDDQQLQFALWDRILHRELVHAGKSIVVDKTPSNALHWQKLVRCWPHARFIILRRDPGAIAASWQHAQPDWDREQVGQYLLNYMTGLNDALAEHGGLLTHYEDLTRDPERELTRICAFLGVPFVPAMLDYGARSPVLARRGLGDWSDKLRSGRVQHVAAHLDPADLPPSLIPVARAWNYL